MAKDVEMIGTVSYFNSETCKSVEYEFSWCFETLEEAKNFAPTIIEQYESDCDVDGGMLDTFYYEYDFLVPEHKLS